jgi:hypothetical protein
MLTVNTSSNVKIASMNTPLTSDVPLDSVVRTLNSVGNSTFTISDANILPAICMATRSTALKTLIALVMAIASVTAGLKSPPDIRKNTHTFTMSEKPKDKAMYNRTPGLNPVSEFVVERSVF